MHVQTGNGCVTRRWNNVATRVVGSADQLLRVLCRPAIDFAASTPTVQHGGTTLACHIAVVLTLAVPGPRVGGGCSGQLSAPFTLHLSGVLPPRAWRRASGGQLRAMPSAL